KAGEYKLHQAMTFDEIIASLKSGSLMGDPAFKLVIPEGIQLQEIAKIIAEQTGYTKEEVMNKLDDPSYVRDLIKRYPNILTDEILAKDIKLPLDAYLIPATYPYYVEKSFIESLVDTLLEQTVMVLAKYVG